MQSTGTSQIGVSGFPWGRFFFKLTYLSLFFGCGGSSLLCAGFLQLWQVGGYCSWKCAGFSLQWLLLLQSTGSRRVSFSRYGSWAQQLWYTGELRGIWDCPRPGIESGSPALQGRFITIGPLGKSPWRRFQLRLSSATWTVLRFPPSPVSTSAPLSRQRGLNSAFFTNCPYIPAKKTKHNRTLVLVPFLGLL